MRHETFLMMIDDDLFFQFLILNTSYKNHSIDFLIVLLL